MALGVARPTFSGPRSFIRALVALLTLVALPGCDDDAVADPKAPIPVVIAGRTFKLEPAIDAPTRQKGLGGRASLPDGSGMLFVFPKAEVIAFVMRDCVMEIDVAFLDPAGRVVAVHEMKVEEPRRPDESPENYEKRLKKYSSRFPSQFVVEVGPGILKDLGVNPGDLIELDTSGLKKRAQ